jgi:hypothetical protein
MDPASADEEVAAQWLTDSGETVVVVYELAASGR